MKALTLSDDEVSKIHTAARIIAQNVKYHYTIPQLVVKVLMNQSKFKEGFRAVYKMGPYTYLIRKRLEKAELMLMEDASIRQIALTLGFSGHQAETNFIKFFKKERKLSPVAWKKNQVSLRKANQKGR